MIIVTTLQRGFALRYERRKEIHADETMHTRTAKPFVPTPALVITMSDTSHIHSSYCINCLSPCVQVNALLLSIKDEVKDYRDKFQPVFRT